MSNLAIIIIGCLILGSVCFIVGCFVTAYYVGARCYIGDISFDNDPKEDGHAIVNIVLNKNTNEDTQYWIIIPKTKLGRPKNGR